MIFKRFFYKICLGYIFIYTVAFPQRKVDFKYLNFFDGKIYMGRESIPYTGFTYEFYDDSDQKKFDGYIRRGLIDGKWTFYHVNGKVKEKGHYRNANPKFLFSSADKNLLPPYKNRNGTWREFYNDGSRYTYGRFINGERWGMHAFYGFKDGLMVRTYFKNNLKNGYEYTFLNSKKIHTGLYRDGIQLWEPLETYNEGKITLNNPFNILYIDNPDRKSISNSSFEANSIKRAEPLLAEMKITLDSGSVYMKNDEQLIEKNKSGDSNKDLENKIDMNPQNSSIHDLYPNEKNLKTGLNKSIDDGQKNNRSKVSFHSGYVPFRIMFRAARKAGISTFTWQGLLYNTKLKKTNITQ
tara:strand:+ start:22053 stop:23111 length:1059 start_codon:yes stop_codon:yes gene_type:complete